MTDPRTAVEALLDTLEGVEFRANVFGLTCSQEDARRIAKAIDAARAALAPVASPESVAGERCAVCGHGKTRHRTKPVRWCAEPECQCRRFKPGAPSDHPFYDEMDAPTPPPPAPESAEALRDALAEDVLNAFPSALRSHSLEGTLRDRLDAIIAAARAEPLDVDTLQRAMHLATTVCGYGMGCGSEREEAERLAAAYSEARRG